MEKTITIDISKENGNVFISEDGSSGATYPVDFSKGNEKVIEDIKKAFPGMNDDEAVYSQSAYRMDEIKHNHIMIADNKLLDEVYEL